MPKMFKCPMMEMPMMAPMAMPAKEEMGMPMMCGMHMPMMGAPMNMPMMNMPMMNMPMMDMDMVYHQDDEEDEEYFMGMHSDVCKKMMPYVKGTLDKMEKKNKMMYEARPERETINIMIENTYKIMIADMPEMAEEEDSRQYGRRRFARDVLGVLLFSELLRRRRRFRRRRPPYGHRNPPYGTDYDFDYGMDDDDDYYYND